MLIIHFINDKFPPIMQAMHADGYFSLFSYSQELNII